MEGQKNYTRALKSMGLFGGVQGLNILLSVVRNKIAAQLIGTVGFGLVDLYNRTLELLSNTTNLGLPFSSIRKISEFYGQGDTVRLHETIFVVRMWTLLTALAGLLCCLALSPLLSLWLFNDTSHATSLCLLSPIVACLTFCGGEMAILKGLRQVRRIATISLSGAFATLFIVIPCYYVGGRDGIIPALLLCSLTLFAIQFIHGNNVHPWSRISFSPVFLKRGIDMIKLGGAYTIAGITTTGAEVFIRTFIHNSGSIADVGLYAAAFTLCVTYSRIVFVAMDADYFPRLSACNTDRQKTNKLINDQINVCTLLMAPALCLFLIFLPLIIRILYTQEFTVSATMAMYASLYIFFKAMTMPIAYLSLAKGDSAIYFWMELIYAVFFILAVVTGYSLYGLTGAGWALSASNLFDLCLIYTCFRRKYGFRFERTTLLRSAIQFVLVSGTLTALACGNGNGKYLPAVVCTILSAALSAICFRKELVLRKR